MVILASRNSFILVKKAGLTKFTKFWNSYYNYRPNDGIGLNGISPKEKLEKLGFTMPDKSAIFPALF
ncbi:MAG: hypothetical protein ABH888_03485 [Patescibacteria group bacterium]